MRKLLISAAIIAFLAFALMVKDILFGQQQHKLCAINDYDCNLSAYLDDISKKPPDFSRASSVAIETPDAIRKNIENINSLGDYESSNMLRVILEYPIEIRQEMCSSPDNMETLVARGRRIHEHAQQVEYARLLSELKCNYYRS